MTSKTQLRIAEDGSYYWYVYHFDGQFSWRELVQVVGRYKGKYGIFYN